MNIQQYDAHPGIRSDTTPAVLAAIKDLRAGLSNRLIFPKGRYHFRPDRAAEEYLFISNNDESLKRIAFPLFDLADIEIDGDGSEFVFHGFTIPFALRNCRNVRLSNFTMDWTRTFHSEAEILDFHEGGKQAADILDLRIAKQFPYAIQHDQLLFDFEGAHVDGLRHMLEFDPDRRETAAHVGDNAAIGPCRATQIEEGIVRLEGKFYRPLTPGNILTMATGKRYCPGIAVMDCEDIAVKNVTIHHCGGMGIIAQRTRNIDLQHVQVTPNPQKDRVVSATADATHFVNCAGLIRMDDCLFENQLDDPTNVHGIYARVSQIIAPKTIEVELVHSQQRGINITQAGDTVEFVGNENLLTYHTAKVTAFQRLNKQYFILDVDTSLPKQLKVGDGVASLGWIPDVTITRCVARSNRARGFLLSTAGRVLVEDNYFHTPGAAILVAGDSNYWFESGKVRDLTIRNNHFDNCLYGVWGQAVIAIEPEISVENRPGVAYHRNITIENNRFDLADPRLLKAYCVDGLTFRDNTVAQSDRYAAGDSNGKALAITDCAHVVISGEIGADAVPMPSVLEILL